MKQSIDHYSAKILVVEDSTLDQFVLRSLLAEHGLFRVACAKDGREGYELAVTIRPDLVLLDVTMPGLDGFATCRLLKANPLTAAIPVIFLSGSHGESERIEGLQLGAVDYMKKPYFAGELIARIQLHLRLANAGKQPILAANRENKSDAAPGKIDADEVIVVAIERYVVEHLSESLCLDGLAHIVGTYREKLSRAFMTRRQITVFEYIRQARILRSCQLLRETSASVGSIALAVGFSSPGNFATAFREKMRTTPAHYRKHWRERDNRGADAQVG